MAAGKKVLIISYSPLGSDPRILRQIDCLSEGYEIYTAGLSPSNRKEELGHITISPLFRFRFHFQYPAFIRKLITVLFVLPVYFFMFVRNYLFLIVFKKYDWVYWNANRRITFKNLLSIKADLIIANDIDALPLAVRLKEKNGGKIYFDAHEYAPLEYENDPKWLLQKSPYLLHLCKKYIPSTDFCTTVSHKIAERYHELTGMPFDVVYNSPNYEELAPIKTDPAKIKCVHHGVASPIRKIEAMINAFISLGPAYELHLLLVVNDTSYYERITKMSEGHSNIFFHTPVSTKDISRFINQFDISLIFIPPVNFNYKYCLPNKFFESIQARLMLLCGPSPEMEFLVEKYDIGAISTGFESSDIIRSLEGIDMFTIEKYKHNSGNTALQVAAETGMRELRQKLEKVLKG